LVLAFRTHPRTFPSWARQISLCAAAGWDFRTLKEGTFNRAHFLGVNFNERKFGFDPVANYLSALQTGPGRFPWLLYRACGTFPFPADPICQRGALRDLSRGPLWRLGELWRVPSPLAGGKPCVPGGPLRDPGSVPPSIRPVALDRPWAFPGRGPFLSRAR